MTEQMPRAILTPSRGGERGFKNAHSTLARFLAGVLLIISVFGCTKSNTPPSGSPPHVSTVTPSLARGRSLYQTQCIACHNSDPHKPGALGPEVSGASRELLEARILRAEYPPGYPAKRQTHSMVAMPHLKNEIESIQIYLNSLP